MPLNLKLQIAYDGTDFYGFQKTKIGATIEGELQKALEIVFQEKLILNVASRTDRGVHAFHQVLNVIVSKDTVNVEKVKTSLNQLLPKAIVVRNVEIVPLDFHATLDVSKKEYVYEITFGPFQMPKENRYAWHIYQKLDFQAMEEAAKMLLGKHDFKAFTNRRRENPYKSTVRPIDSITLDKSSDGHLKVTLIGENFLYKMVRNIVGTLIYVGLKKIALKDLEKVLKSKDRKKAGTTAPPHGLTLNRVDYK